MAASPKAFLANLAGAVATLVRYHEPQLFLYRIRLALEAASVAKVRESWPIRSDGLTFYVRSPVEALIATAKHESRLAGLTQIGEEAFSFTKHRKTRRKDSTLDCGCQVAEGQEDGLHTRVP